MLELHCHTTCSDGSLTPTELVQAAAAAGVKALAISDHDTMVGWDEAWIAGATNGVEIVPALELSTTFYGQPLHVLGFYPDRDRLAEPLQELHQDRIERAERMVQILAALGYPIKLPEGIVTPGRPHIAQALVRAGHVPTEQAAFDRLIGDRKPAYVPYKKLTAIDGVQLLRSCGAVPVWAHPILFRGNSIERTLRELVDAGLLGIEVYHPEHDKSDVKMLLNLAKKYALLITGGSDYHGPNSRGCSLNMMKLGLELLETLKATHASLLSDRS